MSAIQWNGVFPAATTRLKPYFSLDIDAIRKGLERLIDAGVAAS